MLKKKIAHTYDFYGGTAICDWFTRMHEVESLYHPKSVQLEFSGNNLTPCMDGLELCSQPYYEKYKADTLTAIEIFVSGGAPPRNVRRLVTQHRPRGGSAHPPLGGTRAIRDRSCEYDFDLIRRAAASRWENGSSSIPR